jgi:hypothetical protein
MKPGDLVTLKFPENFVIGDAVALVVEVDEPRSENQMIDQFLRGCKLLINGEIMHQNYYDWKVIGCGS